MSTPARIPQELQIQQRQSDDHLMRAIEDAPVQIYRGSFGVCEVCKCLIPKARLETVPWTRDCKEESDHNPGGDG